MKPLDAADAANRYCRRLRLAVPDLDTAVRSSDVTIAQLMALAVLEAGGPLTLEAIAERLGRLALPPRLQAAGHLASLRKAWHGQPPLVRDAAGRLFYLDLLSHHDIRYLAYVAGCFGVPFARPEPAVFQPPPDSVPLSQAEVQAAFHDRTLYGWSSVRRAAAMLEAGAGGPQSLDALNAGLTALSDHGAGIDERALRSWKSDLVSTGPDGLLHLNAASRDLPALRRAIRKMAAPRLRQQAETERSGAWRAERKVVRDEEEQHAMAEARRARRALVHIVTVDGLPRAAAVIDGATGAQRLFLDASMEDLPAHLDGFDFLAGVDIRASLRAVGVDPDRWWLAELRPTQRTFRPPDRRPVAVRLSSIVHATTGVGGVPADVAVWKRLLAGRSKSPAAGRLGAEAQALFALYQFGALHGGVRVRRRPDERLLPVSWSLSGDPDFEAFVKASIRRWVPVDIVVGPATGLAEPWAGARTVTIVERDLHMLFVRDGGDVRALDPADVHAIRLSGTAAADGVGPSDRFRHDSRICRMTVTLDGIVPPIWRRLDVPAWVTLAKLHDLLQAALGWTNSHLHVFEIGDERIAVPFELEQLADGLITRSARLVTLADVIDHSVRRFGYEYDLGDSWHHNIEIEDVLDDVGGSGWARCLGGARSCPPEDCGGAEAYARLLDLLFEPHHPEFEDVRRWVGRFEPDRFDIREVNAALSAVPWH
jgi:hypothetical protein